MHGVSAASKTINLVLDAIDKNSGRCRPTSQWSSARINILKGKVEAEKIAAFEKSCAHGQLAAAEGDFGAAERLLVATLREFPHLYPNNGHFFTHILQLALAAQLTDVVALFLDDRHGTPNLFRIELGPEVGDPVTNRVTVDDVGGCHFYVHPRITCMQHADYFVAHWLSGALLWAAFCRSPECGAGSVLMNSGEAGYTPGLAYCGNKPEHILVADGYFLGSKGYADLHSRYDAVRLPWEARKPIAFWRGATTGIRTGRLDWQSLPRIQMCQLAQINPSDLDVGISEVVQSSEQDRQAIQAAKLIMGRVPAEEFLKYKYQIDIDGNSNAWPGLYQRLLTGSPVLKVASPHGYRQWYYDLLKPWVNYVPVESDMADLVSKIQWLRAHDDDARAIGDAGLSFARSLQYERELAFSCSQIRAAFCSLQARPEVTYRYNCSEHRRQTLHYGWDLATDGSVWGLGSCSIIKLPRLAMVTDYEICLELEPHIDDPHVLAQRVSIVANGVVIAERLLRDRQEVRCVVAGDIIRGGRALEIQILHPDGFAPSSYRPTRDDRVLSIAIHSLSATSRVIGENSASDV